MSDKQTFLDRETGEDIESTPLARWGTRVAVAMAAGMGVGLYALLGSALLLTMGLPVWAVLCFPIAMALVVFGVALWCFACDLSEPVCERLHNAIARWEHRKRETSGC